MTARVPFKNNARRIAILRERIAELHARGLSDPAIARTVGLGSGAAVGYHRRQMGLASQRASRPAVLARLARLHGEGLYDAQIADRLNLSASTIWRYRQALGLPRQQARVR